MPNVILSFSDLQSYIQQVVGQYLAGLGRKVAIGKVVLTKEGWLRVPFLDVAGNPITFSESPTVSVACSGISKEIKKPIVTGVSLSKLDSIQKYSVGRPTLAKYQIQSITKPYIPLPSLTIPSFTGNLSLPTIPTYQYTDLRLPYIPQIDKSNIYPKFMFNPISITVPVVLCDAFHCETRTYTVSCTPLSIIQGQLLYWYILTSVVDDFNKWLGNQFVFEGAAIKTLRNMMGSMGVLMASFVDKLIDGLVESVDLAISKVVEKINSMIGDPNNPSPGTINYMIKQINDAMTKVSTLPNKLVGFRDALQNAVSSWIYKEGSIDCLTYKFNYGLSTYADNTKDAVNGVVSANVNDIEGKIRSVVDGVNTVVGTLTDDINSRLSTIVDRINSGLDALKGNISNGIGALVDSIWDAIGIVEQKLVFMPAMIRNVSVNGFEIYSKGGNVTVYYIAIGK